MFKLSSLRLSSFSWDCALSLAMASKLAYERSSTVENLTKSSWGFTQCLPFDVGETQGFVAAADDVVLLVFRGSESVGDWIGNLDVAMVDRDYGRVHRGFVSAFDTVKSTIAASFATVNPVGKRVWVTGHSLGGALATIAAAELKDSIAGATVHTFGQPRVGDSHLLNFVRIFYQNRFFRFVNEDDIVTRLPPFFSHVGRLIHFDGDGRVTQSDSESVAANAAEAPPLTEAEFEKLKVEIRKVKAQLGQEGRAANEAALDASIEGLIPGFSILDHRIDRYIAAIRTHSGDTAVSATLAIEESSRISQEATESLGGPPARKRISGAVPVLLRVTDQKWVPPAGLTVSARVGNIFSASGTVEVIRKLESDPNVSGIEISRDGGRHELATSIPFVHGDQVQTPPIDEKGDTSLVGVIDGGIDVLHEAFRDAQSLPRILAVWDQRNPAGPSPHSVDPAHFSQTLGTLYVRADIRDFIAGIKPVPPALRDPQGHGTHVTSIAAGRKIGPFAGGMAPEAGIVVVIPKLQSSPADPVSVGYSSSHLQALEFLKIVSKGGNLVSDRSLPMAVNVSLGMNAGAHDGSSLLEAGFDSITTKGRDPGFVVVKSAGNERGFGGHARVQAFVGQLPVQWESDATFRFEDYLEIWYDSFDEIEFSLTDPAGNVSPVVSRTNPNVTHVLGGNVCHFKLVERHVDNGDNQIAITISPQSNQIQAGLWTLNVIGIKIQSRDAIVDLWVERDDARAIRFKPESQEVTLSIPGTAETVITVAACQTGQPLQLTSSSSFGRTRDGRAKPDICAPGHNIVAAMAGQANIQATVAMTGTSMAAPHVTGALALVMSHRQKEPAKPQHNAQQLRAALNASAKFRTVVHNPGVGYGMLDAKELFDLLK